MLTENELINTYDIPLDEERFTLVDRWYFDLLQTFFPCGTTMHEIMAEYTEYMNTNL